MSIKTFKVRHNADLSRELQIARQVAEFALAHKGRWLTSKAVKHLGLKADLSTGVLNKYCRNRNLKRVGKAPKITVSGFNTRFRLKEGKLYIPSLRLYINIDFLPPVIKYNQIELDAPLP